MFGFLPKLRNARRSTKVRSNRAILALESLENRDCPAGGPIISDFLATQVSAQNWNFSGQVLDQSSSPSGLTVNLGGLPSLTGVTVTTASDGTFSVTETLANDEAGLATALTTDGNGVLSNLAVALADAPSNLSLSISYVTQQIVNLSGQVTGANAADAQVKFSGSAMGMTVAGVNGAFSVDLQASGTGTILAVATDDWGVSSNQASVPVTVTNSSSFAPYISNFTATQDSGQTWTFSGSAWDMSQPVLTITLGGLPSLSGVTATTTANGTFSATVTLQPGEAGYATAMTTDANGETSNLATVFVDAPLNLSFSVCYEDQRMVTLSGEVQGSDPAGAIVQFYGSAICTAITSANGSFSVEVQASCLGCVYGNAIDTWGVISNQAIETIACPVPEIIDNIDKVSRNNYWQFLGTVVAPSAPGLTVTFVSLVPEGTTATVQADGTFVLAIQIPPNVYGNVSATVTDWWGQESQDVFYCVPLP
jgi:hypothetical protein